ncbi:hypothetical protein BDV98DRAFT_405779 [Pterulicium gracile]|uniref:Secreted protein n=1 Tax=Pterulicium gracile TaxID=1884261 RepID=A0A5C3QM29_9AGAR|nr:hypothetical protein BDV98DRAFT_405779 [Pterula gracilis]
MLPFVLILLTLALYEPFVPSFSSPTRLHTHPVHTPPATGDKPHPAPTPITWSRFGFPLAATSAQISTSSLSSY